MRAPTAVDQLCGATHARHLLARDYRLDEYRNAGAVNIADVCAAAGGTFDAMAVWLAEVPVRQGTSA